MPTRHRSAPIDRPIGRHHDRMRCPSFVGVLPLSGRNYRRDEVLRRRARVLLVEDNESHLELFAEALREEFAVWVARDGTHAMEVAEELGWDVDAIVCDLRLGEGPRGDQFLAYFRTREKRSTAVVVVSADTRAAELGRNARPDAVLEKPVSLDVLVGTVRQLVAGTR